MRSKGRYRPMSATLTPERKSARDRPASSKESERGEGGEKAGDRPKSSGSGRRRVTLVKPCPSRVREPVLQHNEGAGLEPSHSRRSWLNSRSLRRPPVVEPMTPPPCRARPRSYVEPRCRRRPRRRRPAWTPYRHPLSAALATRLPLAPPSMPHLSVSRARAHA